MSTADDHVKAPERIYRENARGVTVLVYAEGDVVPLDEADALGLLDTDEAPEADAPQEPETEDEDDPLEALLVDEDADQESEAEEPQDEQDNEDADAVDLSEYAQPGGMYELPNGERVRGRDNALAALAEHEDEE